VKVWAGPNEIIRLCHDNPRRQIVKTKMAFQSRRNLDGVGSIGWTRVSDQHDRHDFSAFDDLTCGHDGAWTIFVAFFRSSAVLGRPKVRIADHKTGTRCR